MKKLLIISLIGITSGGCQFDIQGPSMSAKVFYGNENNGDVYKSRGSGMSGGNSYASNGGQMQSTGDGSKVRGFLIGGNTQAVEEFRSRRGR